MYLFWIGLALTFTTPALVAGWLTVLHVYLRVRYLHLLGRIFQEKPLFIVPRGQPLDRAERVRFPSPDGVSLNGIYLKAPGPRRGVILFGLEFGSDCWSCWSYCEHLVAAGYDVFAFESRNQGSSEHVAGYDPLQWVTEYEVRDAEAALTYLKARPDADPRGVGFFGISKGAGAGLLAASRDPWVRCFVTDGVFATYSTVVPYMRHWFRIYNSHHRIQGLLPSWYYGLIGLLGLAQTARERKCRFPHLESAMRRLAPRPLLMIHGEADTYIKPGMARELFARAREPRELWIVEGAKHNQALHVAGEEYRARVLRFFDLHLGARAPAGDLSSGHETHAAEPPPAPRPVPGASRSQPAPASCGSPS